MTTDLERICNPVFQCICNYWQLSCITNMVDRERFKYDITKLLAEAEKKSREGGARLEKEFAWIEKPLIFFIDYMVKEGRFSFREEWMELARNYNELSGDEKFFDILNETLDNPDFNNSFLLFYIMLGLGFNGVYQHNSKYIEQCMRLCMEKAVIDFDIYSESITPSRRKKQFFSTKRKSRTRTAIIASVIFMAGCLLINLIVFAANTDNYRRLLKQTAEKSAQWTSYSPARQGSR